MRRSLQRQLSLMLGGAILLAALVAAAASFTLAYFEATEFQDDILRQVAALHVGDTARSPESPEPKSKHRGAGNVRISDPEARITVIHLPRDPRPEWLDENPSAGFHTLGKGHKRLRIFVYDGDSGKRTVAAQRTTARDELAIDSALYSLIPLLLLLPVIALLIMYIVRRELAPITRISVNLDSQAAERPQPISDEGLPDEITPFVHAINRLLERVNLLIGQQRRFIADAAHELRSPLTALSVQAQNLTRAESLEAMRERVPPLQLGIERARQLTEQLLSLAKTQAGTGDDSQIDVSSMARELIAECLPVAEARQIDLGLEESTALSLYGSPHALRLIIRNALDNALKYTQPGGEVTLRLCASSDYKVVEIIDNGPGIPVEERARVLDAFYRVVGSGTEGNGLGLAIACEAAARLGGVLSLHAPERGSGLLVRYRQ